MKIVKIKFPSDHANDILSKDTEVNRYLDELNNHSVGEVIINKENNELIGYVFVRKDSGNEGFIYNLIVQPKYRGKGFGKMLTDDAVKKLGGYDLTVKKINYRAIQLYKDYGFEIISDGNDESEYYMKLEK
jgi:ribosomal protein S18 acetylase RimI-like enzyme